MKASKTKPDGNYDTNSFLKAKYFPSLAKHEPSEYENKSTIATRKQRQTEQTHYIANATIEHYKNYPVHKSRNEDTLFYSLFTNNCHYEHKTRNRGMNLARWGFDRV